MSEDRDDTLRADTSPTEAPGAAHDTPGPRIRPSEPNRVSMAGADYPALVEVDPSHYVLVGELARGGMGRIQLVRDRRLGRDVALKEVLSTSATIVRRFEREARITARLQHPSIVAVHEAGTWPSGEPFYAMRLVSGRSFDEAIAAAPTFEARLALLPHLLAVADAMAYAHGQHVIHRDLKPRNVMVGEFGETVVIDWGLAKQLGEPEPGASGAGNTGDSHASDAGASAGRRRGGGGGSGGASGGAGSGSAPGETTIGDVLGTPAYMPPEQASGEPVDERADVYAIGAMLYHVLANRAPFEAPTGPALLAAVHEGPPPPLASLAPAAPAELVAITERAMARDPAARYPSAHELAEDLRRFQTGQLVGAHRYSMRQLVRRWARRYRTPLIATAVAAAVALTIGVFAVARIVDANRAEREQHRIAVANQQDAEDLMRFMLVDLKGKLQKFGRVDLLDAVARRAAGYYDHRGTPSSLDDAYLAATARESVAVVLETRGDIAGARAEYAAATGIAETLHVVRPDEPRYAVLAVRMLLDCARETTSLADLPAAEAFTRDALAISEPMLAAHPDTPELIDAAELAHRHLADVLRAKGQPAAALDEARVALALLGRRKADPTDQNLARQQLGLHAELGKLLDHSKHDRAGALTEYRAGLAIGLDQLARDPRNTRWLEDVAISHNEVASVLQELDDLAGAIAELRAGVAISDQLVAMDPTNASWQGTRSTNHERLGIQLMAQSQYAAARPEFELARKIQDDLVARDPSNAEAQRSLSVMVVKLGDVAAQTADVAGALDAYRSAAAMRAQLVARDPTNTQWRRDLFYVHYKMAGLLGSTPKRTDEGLEEARRALAIAVEAATRSPDAETAQEDVVGSHELVGDLLMLKHDSKAAKDAYETALAVAQRASAGSSDADWAHHVSSLQTKLANLAGAAKR